MFEKDSRVFSLSCQSKSDNMKSSLTIAEKIISTLLLIIGVLFTYQAIAGYIGSYIICIREPTSYRISITTFASNLLVGNLLIISSLLFFSKKPLGALLFQYTGIMFILYAINLNFFDALLYNIDWFTISISVFVLLPFGTFLYIYFKSKNDCYKNKFIIPSLILWGVVIFIYIDLFFCGWYYFFYGRI